MQSTHEFTADNLFAASQVQPVVSDKGTLTAGQGVLVRGTLLTTADGVNYTKVKAEEDVYAVLAETTDTTSAVEVPLYLTGEFNKRALIVDDAANVEDFLLSARKAGIFIKDTIA